MPSSIEELVNELGTISSQPNASRPSSYHALIKAILNSPTSGYGPHQLQIATSTYLQNAVFNDLNSTGGGLIVGRQVLTNFEAEIAKIVSDHRLNDRMDEAEDGSAPAITDPEVRRKVLEDALEKLQPRVLSFEEQASALRSQLSDLLESEEDWVEAARVLQAIPLDSGHRTVSDQFKLKMYMRIVRLLLEGDDPVGADVYLKRASMVLHNVPGVIGSGSFSDASKMEITNQEGSDEDQERRMKELEEAKVLGLQFKLCQARIYDAQRRFSEASVRYHELSYVAEIDEGERNMMLSAAVTASILSPAGPQRSRILATLIRDERTHSLPQHTILSKVFLEHIIRPHEIQAFEKLLAPHQVARLASNSSAAVMAASSSSTTTDDTEMESSPSLNRPKASTRHAPSTVLDRAMIEHNLLSASRLYSNITLSGLGSLLDLSPQGAEETARRMIVQGRLKAWIDQVGSSTGGVLFFVDQDRKSETGLVAGGLGNSGPGGEAQPSSGSLGAGVEGAGGSGGSGDGIEGLWDSVAADLDSKWTKRWDSQISRAAGSLEDVCQKLGKHGVVAGRAKTPPASVSAA